MSELTYVTIIGARYLELDTVQNDIIQFGNYLQEEQCTRGGFLPIFWDAPYSYINASTDIGEVVDWEHQGPPRDGQTIPHANSWFYVPLLLAGANQLHPDASQEWRAHPRAGPEWQNLVTQLREAPAIPWQQLHHTLQTLQQLARDTGHQLPAAETALVEQLVTAGSREPAGAQIHLTWAMNIFAQTSGYVPAILQYSTTATKWSMPLPTRNGFQAQVEQSSRAVSRPVLE